MANNQTVTNKQSTFKNDSNDDYVVETEDQGSGVQRQVVKVAETALPTGAATEAKQDTIIGHVDGIETTLTSIDGKDFATQTTLAAAEAHLGAIDTDTSTIAGDTTSIDAKITACNTGAVTVSNSALPTGAATEATLSAAEIHAGNIETEVAGIHTKIDATGVSAQEVQGNQSVNAALSGNVMPISSNELLSSQQKQPTLYDSGGVIYQLVLAPDTALNFPSYKSGTGEQYVYNSSTDNTKGNARYATVDSQGNTLVRSATRANTTHNTTTLTTATETTILSAGGAGVYHDITKIVLSNTSNEAVRVDIRDSTAGTIRWSVGLAPKGGAVMDFDSGHLTQAAANNNWTAQTSKAITDVRVNVVAIKNS